MDPINPVAGNPEAVNPSPEIPTPKDPHGITIAAMAIFVLLALGAVAFLYYQNQQLKTMLASYQTQTAPTPTTTTNPTASWKTYTNSTYNFSFKYPPNVFIKEGDGINMPLVFIDTKEIQIPAAWDHQLTPVDISVKTSSLDGAINTSIYLKSSQKKTQLPDPLKGYIFEGTLGQAPGEGTSYVIVVIQIPNSGRVLLVNFMANATFERSLFDQIISTFKFITPTSSPSASPVACTQEAKLCPNGTYVGRTGPNCEFAPCPSP